jgi:hypothetical protein
VIPLAFGFTDVVYARGIFDVASVIRHSCDPMAECFGHGRYLIVYARKDMAAGEEVTLAYRGVDISRPKAARAAALGRPCTCGRCQFEGDGDGEEEGGPVPATDAAQAAPVRPLVSTIFDGWLPLTVGRLPEFNATATVNPMATWNGSRAEFLELTHNFLDNNGSRLLLPENARLRASVTQQLARLLAPIQQNAVANGVERAHWAQTYIWAKQLLDLAIAENAYGVLRWQTGMFTMVQYVRALYMMSDMKGDGSTATGHKEAMKLTPVVDTSVPVSRFALAQYLTYPIYNQRIQLIRNMLTKGQ